MDAVKQKRQLGLKAYAGTFDCARKVVASEGVRALYAGYLTTLVMNVPYAFIYFASYDTCRHYMNSDPNTYNLPAHLLSGAVYVQRFYCTFLLLTSSLALDQGTDSPQPLVHTRF